MKPIYLEPDEEITSVIDKLSAVSDHRLAVVVPKNGTLFQSLINLKLLAKEAKKQGKEVVIISTNRVGARLAQQVGFQTYSSLGAIAPGLTAEPPSELIKPSVQPVEPVAAETINGIRVNQYNPDVPAANEPVTAEPALPEPTPSEAAEPPLVLSDGELQPAATEPKADAAEAPTDKSVKTTEPELAPVALADESAHDKPAEDDHNLPPIVARTIKMASPRQPIKIPWKSVGVGSALVVVALIVVYFFLPKAVVTLTLPAKAVNQTLNLTVNTSVATGQAETISGTALTVTESDTKAITATGQKNVGTAATGTITLYNGESSSPITLKAGTTLTASSQTFTLDSTATIPGATVSGGSLVAGQTTAAVTASAVGSDSNLSNVQFSISNQPSKVYGQGSTAGGTTKEVTVLAQNDVDSAVDDLKTALLGQANTDLQTKAGSGKTILSGATSVTVTNQSVDQAVGAQVSTANLSMSIQASAIAFSKTAADNAAVAAASKGLKSDQQLVVPSSQPITLTFQTLSDDQSSMTIATNLQGFAVQKISQTAIAKAVAHHSRSGAEALVKKQYAATKVAVSLSPSWWPPQLPFWSRAITVDYSFNGVSTPSH